MVAAIVFNTFTVFLLLAVILFVVAAVLFRPPRNSGTNAWATTIAWLGAACFAGAFLFEIWFKS